jgi:hypothetical protein
MNEPAAAEPPSATPPRGPANARLRLVTDAPSQTFVSPREGFQPPRPLRSAAFPLAASPLALVLWVQGVLPGLAAIGLGLSSSLLAAIASGLRIRDLRQSRSLGDALLRAYPGRAPLSELAAWRATELTAPRSRHQEVNLVRALMRETERRMRSSRTPLGRAPLDQELALLSRIEHRLGLLAAPVSAVGVLELHALVKGQLDPTSSPTRTSALRGELARALAALDPDG